MAPDASDFGTYRGDSPSSGGGEGEERDQNLPSGRTRIGHANPVRARAARRAGRTVPAGRETAAPQPPGPIGRPAREPGRGGDTPTGTLFGERHREANLGVARRWGKRKDTLRPGAGRFPSPAPAVAWPDASAHHAGFTRAGWPRMRSPREDRRAGSWGPGPFRPRRAPGTLPGRTCMSSTPPPSTHP